MNEIVDSFFSDGTAQFRLPSEPEAFSEVRIRLRTFTDCNDKIYIVVDGKRHPMHFAARTSNDTFDLYEASIKLSDKPVRYYFLIKHEGRDYFYDRVGMSESYRSHFDFTITPGFKTPEWAKGAVFYQIYVDRFCNGDITNDVLTGEYAYIGDHVKRVEEWGRYPQAMDVRDFYGGDLAGIKQKLDYLQELGVEVIYLNPIFVSPSNHKYDAQDYDTIDPHYGVIAKRNGELLQPGDLNNAHATSYRDAVANPKNKLLSEELFISLVEDIHKRGMKIILDGVFNHCGSFNKWLDREHIYGDLDDFPDGAFESKDSPYKDYFTFKDQNAWPNNESYDGWWDHNTLPKLNYEGSKELYEYIMNIGRKWVSPPFNCDGWRLDVAADLGHSEEFNHQFWKDFRKAVKEANPNAIILAEHYGNPSAWLKGDEWDTIMNYDAFMEPLTWFFTGMEKHSDACRPDLLNNGDAFAWSLLSNMSTLQTSSILVSMNELSNHDHSRFLTRTNMRVGRTATVGPQSAEEGINKAVLREAVVFQMTWPGAPTVYYGDEAGLCGWTDPDNRRTFPWGKEDKDLVEFHKDVIKLHRSYEALKSGSTKILKTGEGIFAFGRFNEDEKIVTVFNNNFREQELVIPVWKIGCRANEFMVRLIKTTDEGHSNRSEIVVAENGNLFIKLPPYSSVVYKNLRNRMQ